MLITEPIGNIPLERSRHKWEDNIRVYIKKKGVETRNLIYSA
jgi:hypothetical protein